MRLTAAGASLSLSFVLLAVGPRDTSAQSIFIGTPGLAGSPINALPFGSGPSIVTELTGYQQGLSSTLFSGPTLISGVRFFSSTEGIFSSATYSLYLGYTNVTALAFLSPILANNLSSPASLFGSLALSGPFTPTVTFVGTPFLYDPALGNLLMDFRIAGWTPGGGPLTGFEFYWDAPVATTTCGRAANLKLRGAPSWLRDENCLVTEVITGHQNVVPEPTTMTLLATGLASMVAARRRQKKA